MYSSNYVKGSWKSSLSDIKGIFCRVPTSFHIFLLLTVSHGILLFLIYKCHCHTYFASLKLPDKQYSSQCCRAASASQVIERYFLLFNL